MPEQTDKTKRKLHDDVAFFNRLALSLLRGDRSEQKLAESQTQAGRLVASLSDATPRFSPRLKRGDRDDKNGRDGVLQEKFSPCAFSYPLAHLILARAGQALRRHPVLFCSSHDGDPGRALSAHACLKRQRQTAGASL